MCSSDLHQFSTGKIWVSEASVCLAARRQQPRVRGRPRRGRRWRSEAQIEDRWRYLPACNQTTHKERHMTDQVRGVTVSGLVSREELVAAIGRAVPRAMPSAVPHAFPRAVPKAFPVALGRAVRVAVPAAVRAAVPAAVPAAPTQRHAVPVAVGSAVKAAVPVALARASPIARPAPLGRAAPFAKRSVPAAPRGTPR